MSESTGAMTNKGWVAHLVFGRVPSSFGGLIDTTSLMSTMVAEARVCSQQGQHIHGVGRHVVMKHLS